MNRRTMLAATAGAVTTGFAGCLGAGEKQGQSNDGTGDLGDPAETAAVVLTGEPNRGFAARYASLWFEPGVVHISPGGTIQWQIKGHEKIDDHRHSVASYHPDTHGPQRIPSGVEPWKSPVLTTGDTYEHTFEKTGIYDYVDSRQLCISHEVLGAVGRVVVGWPDLRSEPAYQHNVGRLPSQAETNLAAINERTRERLRG